jgi:O-antigen/teichoic acid export membrane protein
MRELFGRLGRQTLVYGVGGALLQAVALVTLPIYTRVFTPAQFGLLEVASVGFTALLVLVDSGMSSAAQRSFYDYPEEQDAERRSALVTGLTIMLAMGLVVAAVLLPLAAPISGVVFGSRGHADLVRIVGVSVPVATLAAYMREVMRLRLRPWRYVVSAMIGAVGTAVAGIVAVLSFNAGVSGVLLAILIGSGLSALFGVAIVGRDIVGRFSWSELRRMVHYGAPLVPAAAAMWGLTFLDRVMLSQLGSFSETGEYAVGSRYATVLMFAVTTFMTAYVPFVLALWQDDAEAERQVRGRVLTYTTLALVTGGLVLSLFARELTTVIAPGYDRAYQIVGVLSTGVAVYGVASVAAAGISLSRQTKYVGIYTVVAVALNVALNLLLIPAWGMVGAAVSTAAAYCLLAVLYYWKAQQLYPTPYMLRRVVTILLVGCPLMGVGAISMHPLALAIAVKLFTLALFGLAVWRFRLIDEDEFRAFLSVLRRARPQAPLVTPTPAP